MHVKNAGKEVFELRVDFPWSIWAMIEKLRIRDVGLSNLSEEGWGAAAAKGEDEKRRHNDCAACRCPLVL